MGQQQVAHKTGYSRSSVAKAEAGRQLLTREFWKTVDGLLQADGALLADYERVLAAKQEHERRSREAELAQAYAEARALRATTTPDPLPDAGGGGLGVPTGQEVLTSLVRSVDGELATGLAGLLTRLGLPGGPPQATLTEWREQLTKFLYEWADTMNLNRRELHQLLGWMTTTVAAFLVGSLNTDEQERLAKAIAAPSRVDDQVIDHIETMLQHCKQQHDALGPQAVLHTVLAQRQLLRSLLDECPAERRPRLLSLDSSMSSSLGFYFFDLDDAASAMHYGDQARAAAQEGSSLYQVGYLA